MRTQKLRKPGTPKRVGIVLTEPYASHIELLASEQNRTANKQVEYIVIDWIKIKKAQPQSGGGAEKSL